MRIAKYISHCGYCSRRAAEKLVVAELVTVNGLIITNLATQIQDPDIVTVEGVVLSEVAPRIWLYNKPVGLVTTHNDPEGRATVFEYLPTQMPRVVSVGRLDLNSEGLLILTNIGQVARYFELPQNAFVRTYKVRAYGHYDLSQYGAKNYIIDPDGTKLQWDGLEKVKQHGKNGWYHISLRQGKNREVRRIFEFMGLQVNRLIRISYGPFLLGNLAPGEVREVETSLVQEIMQQIKE